MKKRVWFFLLFLGLPSLLVAEGIHQLIVSGNVRAVREYFQRHPEAINKPTFPGSSDYPLHMATIPRNPEIARFLIEQGAIVDQPGCGEATPLHFACSWGNSATIRLLVEAGADPNLRTVYLTPLMKGFLDAPPFDPAWVEFLAPKTTITGSDWRTLRKVGKDLQNTMPDRNRVKRYFQYLHHLEKVCPPPAALFDKNGQVPFASPEGSDNR